MFYRKTLTFGGPLSREAREKLTPQTPGSYATAVHPVTIIPNEFHLQNQLMI